MGDPLRDLEAALTQARRLLAEGAPGAAFGHLDWAVRTCVERIRDQQSDALAVEADADEGQVARRPKPLEQARERLFAACPEPETILRPANIIAMYLHDHPSPKVWAWEETRALNERMLEFVRSLDPSDPIPNDPRLALPMTAGGFALLRALRVDTQGMPRTHPHVVMDVYDEIAQGIVSISDRVKYAIGEAVDTPAFNVDIATVAMAAETLLLFAVRLGPEIWPLLLSCPLVGGCRKRQPYYITRPEDEDDPHHDRCRMAAMRAKRRAVTT